MERIDDKPPQGDAKEPPSKNIFNTRDNRSTAVVVLRHLRGAGAGSSRGAIVSCLRDNLLCGCGGNINPSY